MTTFHRDFETRSAADLRKTGAHAYAEHVSTDVWCMAYAVDDEPVKLWAPGDPVPPEYVEAARNPEWISYAHNAAFERAIEHYVMVPRYGWPVIPLEQQRCTMAQALAMALPGGLDDLAIVLGVEERKDAKGHRDMLKLCRPRKRLSETEFTWWDEADALARLYKYCIQDVVVEREVGKRLLPLRASELRLWHLDQRINERGVRVDKELCQAAKKIVFETQSRLDKRMLSITDGFVRSGTDVARIVAFLTSHGIETDSIAKDRLGLLLERDDLPQVVREVLQIRAQAARASVAKIDALLAGMSKDGRARGLLQYHGASTGRWSGRRFQPQNIRRGDSEDVGQLIEMVRTGDIDLIEMIYGDPLRAVSNCLRGMIRAG